MCILSAKKMEGLLVSYKKGRRGSPAISRSGKKLVLLGNVEKRGTKGSVMQETPHLELDLLGKVRRGRL